MQHVNYDMDDLFRKAGEQYPLNTNSADWSKVQSALNNAKPEPPLKEKKRVHRALYLLFLVPFALICNQIYDVGVNNNPVTNQLSEPVQANIENTVSTSSPSETTSPVQAEAVPNVNDHVTPNLNFNSKFNRTGTSPSFSIANKGTVNAPMNNDRNRTAEMQTNANNLPATDIPVAINKPSVNKVDNTVVGAQEVIAANEQKKDSSIETKTQPTNSSPQKSAVKKKRFYAAALFGPDITTVKMQKITDAGLDFGLLLGYNFSDKLSIETGAISSRKEYYASGEYLTKYSGYLPSNIMVTYGEGSCRMIEVPLLAKYIFKPGSKNNWFLAAGTSSYFMKEEDYEYYYKNTTTGDEWSRNREYKSSSSSYLAVAEISGGVSRPLGKFGDLRVQPYIKLPLRKVGYNELPLTSGGIHLVLSKKLF